MTTQRHCRAKIVGDAGAGELQPKGVRRPRALVAKLEKLAAVERLDELAARRDAVMLARGDPFGLARSRMGQINA
jgi:hypothetical protein